MATSENLSLELDIPEGVEVSVSGSTVSAKGPKGALSRTFQSHALKITVKEGKLKVASDVNNKIQRAIAGTIYSHIASMVEGVNKGFTYKLKVVYSHFPMTLKAQGSELVIDNFLGEHYARKSAIHEGVKVEVKGQIVTVSGIDRAAVGQTAANLEQATKILNRDHRVFQDGVYLIDRNGVPVK